MVFSKTGKFVHGNNHPGLYGFMAFVSILITCLVVGVTGANALTLKAAHSYDDTYRQFRHRLLQVFGDEMNRNDPRLVLKVYPRNQLFAKEDQWPALVAGTLEFTIAPLSDYASVDPLYAKASTYSVLNTLKGAYGLKNDPGLAVIRRSLEKRGVRIIADVWLPGALLFTSSSCQATPKGLSGDDFFSVNRELVAAISARLQGLGYKPLHLASSEKNADVIARPEADMLSDPNPYSGCVVLPGAHKALWFDYQPILMSEKTFNSLDKAGRDAVLAAGAAASAYGQEALQRAMDFPYDRSDVLTNDDLKIEFLEGDALKDWEKEKMQEK